MFDNPSPYVRLKFTGTLGDQKSAWSSIYCYCPPEGSLLDQRGYLYVVIDLATSKPLDLALAGKLVFDAVCETYYTLLETSPLHALESSLAKGRERLVDLAFGMAERKDAPEVDLNIVAVAVWGSILYVGRLGEVSSILHRGSLVEEIGGGYTGIVTVASGTIQTGDQFILGSKSFAQTVRLGQLQSFLEQLEEPLSNNAFPLNFSVLLLDFSVSPQETEEVPLSPREVSPPPLPRSRRSLNLRFPFWRKVGDKLKPSLPPIFIRPDQSNLDPFRKKTSKWFLLGVVVLVSLFFVSVFLTIAQKRNRVHSEQVVGLVEKSNEDLKKAEELVDLNNSRAREYLRSAEESLTQAKELAGESSKDLIDLESKLKEMLDKVNKVVRLDEPDTFYDLKVQDGGVTPVSLTGTPTSLLVADGGSAVIYRLLVGEEGSSKVARLSSGDLQGIKALLPGSSRTFAVTGTGLVVVGLEGDSYTKKEFALPIGWERITAADLYAGGFYFLSAADNQIYRSYLNNDTFEDPTTWIEGNFNLADVVSLTVDGDIYVLRKGSGEVVKMSGGAQEEWKLRELDRPLSNPTDIFTTPDSNFLYIADSGNQRVLVVAKESGIYNRQFVAKKVWQNIKDLWVDEETSAIYVLEGTKIYKVSY